MACTKGAASIASRLIPVLIIAALASAAWLYAGGFNAVFRTKIIDVPQGLSYFDGRNVIMTVNNIGTSAIDTSSCSAKGNLVVCGDIAITREGGTYSADMRPSAGKIEPGNSITITDYSCEAGDARYVISSPTSIFHVNVNADKPCSYPNDPVSWWKFDGDATDSTGRNDGIIHGGVALEPTDATRGRVANFNGIDASIGFGDIGIPMNGPATISGWFKFGAVRNNGYLHSLLYVHSANNLYYVPLDTQSWNSSPSVGIWYHVALVYNGAMNATKLYIDKAEAPLASLSSNNVPALADFFVGGVPFNGSIDDVMIFKRALSPEEISAIYNSQNR